MIDQLTKLVAVGSFDLRPTRLGPAVFSVTRNVGGPFGVFPGGSLFWAATSAAVLVAAIVVLPSSVRSPRLGAILGLVLGGGVSNLLDRLLRGRGFGRGGVIDWIGLAPYPKVFNLADIAIRAGAIALAVMLLRPPLSSPSHIHLHSWWSGRDK